MHLSSSNGKPPAPSSSGELTQRQRYIELGLIFAFWTLMVIFAVGHVLLNHPQRGPAEWIGKMSHYYLWAVLTPGIFWVSRRFPLTRSNWPRRLLLHLGIGALIASFYGGVYHYVRGLLLQVPASRVSLPLHWWQELQLGFIDHLFEYLAILGAGIALDHYRKHWARQRQADQLQKQLSEARLEALRMQINPHFLFNALNTVSMLTERDPKAARRVTARLSKLLRYALDKSDEQEVPLERELQFLDDYLDIMQLRFEDRLNVRKDVAPDMLEAQVPPLLLQPLAENAIKHGIGRTKEGGRITIRAVRRGDTLQVSLRDDGPGFDGARDGGSDGIGLKNTRARLHQLYGTAADLSLRAFPGGGTEATVTLPYHTTAELSVEAV
jgi:signal transduction histidine kinase